MEQLAKHRWLRALVPMVLVVIYASGCGADTNAAQVASAVTWSLPLLEPGASCPVTAASDPVRPTLDLGDMIGDGPVRPVGLGTAAVLRFVAPSDSNAFPGSEWGGNKVVWGIAPGTALPIVIRGRQLDGPGLVRFGQAKVPDETIELRSRTSLDGSVQAWQSFPSEVRVQHDGCYGFQIETPTGTSTIVFKAVRSTPLRR